MIRLVICGTPVPWTPARVLRNGYSYSPKANAKKEAIYQIKSQWHKDPLDCAIQAVYTFYMPIPLSDKRTREMVLNHKVVYHTKRPDADNLQKFCSDILNALVVVDDSRICKVSSQKIYGLNPRTEIEIIPMVDE